MRPIITQYANGKMSKKNFEKFQKKNFLKFFFKSVDNWRKIFSLNFELKLNFDGNLPLSGLMSSM